MHPIWIEMLAPLTPRLDRCELPTHAVATVGAVDKKVNLPVDSYGREWCVWKFFSEDSNYQVLQAHKGRMGGANQEAIGNYLQLKPICLEHCKLRLGDLQIGSINHRLC